MVRPTFDGSDVGRELRNARRRPLPDCFISIAEACNRRVVVSGFRIDRRAGANGYEAPISRRTSTPGAAGSRRRSTARVVLGVQALQSFAGDMGIDLRRRDVRMAEQQLHDTQVGAVVEQVRGEGMPEHMR